MDANVLQKPNLPMNQGGRYLLTDMMADFTHASMGGIRRGGNVNKKHKSKKPKSKSRSKSTKPKAKPKAKTDPKAKADAKAKPKSKAAKATTPVAAQPMPVANLLKLPRRPRQNILAKALASLK
jgi:hypothetical protein